MPAHVHDKGQREVDDDGGPERKEGRIDEEEPDGRGSNAHFFSQGGAYSEGMMFKKLLDIPNQPCHNSTLNGYI